MEQQGQEKGQQEAEKMGEIVVIVNEKNEVVDYLSRKEMRERNLFHRASFIFVRDPQTNKLFVHLRHRNKKYAPHHWTVCFGGVVSKGEEYDDNAEKELQEEAGIKGKLHKVDSFCFDGENRVWGMIYVVEYSGELKLQEEECEEYKLMSIEEIKESQKSQKWAPDSSYALEKLIESGFLLKLK